MEPVADENNQIPDTPDGIGFDPSEIDALFSGEGDTKDADAPDQPPAGGAVSQADIDALMGAAGPVDADEDDAPTAAAANESAPRTDTLGRPVDEAPAALASAVEEERLANAQTTSEVAVPREPATDVGSPPTDTRPLTLTDLDDSSKPSVDTKKVTMLNDVKLRVKLQLGRTKMLVEDILNLDEGSVVELDKLAGDPIDVLVNDRLVARGEVLVLNDNFCVRISEVLAHDPHRITT